MDPKTEVVKRSNDCRCGGGSLITKGLCVVSFVITCYFFYRVTVLESRVDYLELKFKEVLSSSKISNRDINAGSSETLSRQKRDVAECTCPPGKTIDVLVVYFIFVGLNINLIIMRSSTIFKKRLLPKTACKVTFFRFFFSMRYF